MKLWQKKYTLNKQVEDFTVGNDHVLDQRLIKYDCAASIAHAKTLKKAGILKEQELKDIVKELNSIIGLEKKGKFNIKKEQEDCHTAIEAHLTKALGDTGKKIHTARSRNDQVQTALRLYYKDELNDCKNKAENLIKILSIFRKKHSTVEFPGYTHTRKAMPSSIILWTDSFIDSMKDNIKLLIHTSDLINQSPLGTGAGYGIPLEIDREYTRKLLGFKTLQNPIYVQNSRGKFESTIIHSLAQIMFDLNKIASDIIIFTMPEFAYFELPDELCTGSSIMPHKKNPDVLELVRARYHIVLSCEFQVKTMTANLISGYHRDLQLTKEPPMKAFDITKETLSVMTLVFQNLEVNEERCKSAMTEELYATEKAYDLVKKGTPFRDAYKIISKEY
ncbi:MAG: argininosuccinate lyase [Candidatus Nanohalarchaeota archaeon]|nr:MAG: argininosuccinate lyase [Candidatus Nanohaloarchaeota archaeon]